MADRFVGKMRRLFQPEPKAEVEEELAFHLEQRARDYVARGLDPAAARVAAQERFGSVDLVRDECAELLTSERRAAVRRDWLDDLRQDLRFGIRAMLRAPMFSLMAMLTLALGIGANAAVFGVLKSVLLDALPYADADRLVRVYSKMVDGTLDRSSVSAAAFRDMAERQRSFERMAAFYQTTYDVVHHSDAGPRVVYATMVGKGFFDVLGVQPAAGRMFSDVDIDERRWVTVLSHEAWQREFGGDRGVLGTMMRIHGDAYEIVGVLPRGFVGPMGEADVYFPLNLESSLADPVRARKQHWLGVIGRRRPEVTIAAAQEDLARIHADLAREHPDSDTGITAQTVSLRDSLAGNTRTPLVVLMASAALVLLITCANLAGALLSRTISRRKEFAVRVALGAGRGRLVRQLLTETMLLAIAGGALGLLLASMGLAALRTLAAPALPPYAELSIDRGAAILTALLALCTGLAFGLVPSLSAPRGKTQETLRDQNRGTSEGAGSRRLRGLLVAGQIALSVSLLAGAALLTRSLWALTTAPLGYNPNGILTISLKGPVPARDEERRQFFDQLETRARAIPGVTAVGSANELPSPSMNRNGLAIRGVNWPTEQGQPFIAFSNVSDDYFRTMRIPVRGGRSFDATDHFNAPGAIVINETLARRYWPNGDALGAQVRFGPDASTEWSRVVGIVGDVRHDPARPTAEPMAFGSSRQDQLRSTRTLLLRTDGAPLALLSSFRRELAALDPTQAITEARVLDDVLAEGLVSRKLPVLLIGAFGALALLLASVGVYAMFANMAAAREREFGVRVALGSGPRAIAALVLRQGGVWMLIGLAAGAVGVVFVARLVRGLLFDVTPFDPIALGAAVLILGVCATIALLVPVHRATRVDPITVLR